MTSIAGSFAKKQEGITRFLKPDSPCYDESGVTRLFPFVYRSGELDISYEGNTFKATMVDEPGILDPDIQNPGPEDITTAPSNESETAIYIMGGPRLVTSLGPNFKAYIRAWRDLYIDEGSPIELYQPSQVIRVQESDLNNVTAVNGDSYRISNFPPVSDTYTAGTTTNNYYTTFIFKTPLTFTTVEGGVTKYITFATHLDQE
jgi:hypothetical protein